MHAAVVPLKFSLCARANVQRQNLPPHWKLMMLAVTLCTVHVFFVDIIQCKHTTHLLQISVLVVLGWWDPCFLNEIWCLKGVVRYSQIQFNYCAQTVTGCISENIMIYLFHTSFLCVRKVWTLQFPNYHNHLHCHIDLEFLFFLLTSCILYISPNAVKFITWIGWYEIDFKWLKNSLMWNHLNTLTS